MFSDGSPITAEDVKWSLDRARDPKAGIWNFIDESIGAVDIKDPEDGGADAQAPRPRHRGGPQRLQQRHHAEEGSSRPCRARRSTTRPRPSPSTPSAPAPSCFVSWSRGQDDEARQATQHYWRPGLPTASRCPTSTASPSRCCPTTRRGCSRCSRASSTAPNSCPSAASRSSRPTPSSTWRCSRPPRWPTATFNVRPKLKSGADNPLANVEGAGRRSTTRLTRTPSSPS